MDNIETHTIFGAQDTGRRKKTECKNDKQQDPHNKPGIFQLSCRLPTTRWNCYGRHNTESRKETHNRTGHAYYFISYRMIHLLIMTNWSICWLINWCLAPTLAVFQLYCSVSIMTETLKKEWRHNKNPAHCFYIKYTIVLLFSEKNVNKEE